MEIFTNELKISPIQAYLAARALIEPIRDFYKIPENEAKFQAWLKMKQGSDEASCGVQSAERRQSPKGKV